MAAEGRASESVDKCFMFQNSHLDLGWEVLEMAGQTWENMQETSLSILNAKTIISPHVNGTRFAVPYGLPHLFPRVTPPRRSATRKGPLVLKRTTSDHMTMLAKLEHSRELNGQAGCCGEWQSASRGAEQAAEHQGEAQGSSETR